KMASDLSLGMREVVKIKGKNAPAYDLPLSPTSVLHCLINRSAWMIIDPCFNSITLIVAELIEKSLIQFFNPRSGGLRLLWRRGRDNSTPPSLTRHRYVAVISTIEIVVLIYKLNTTRGPNNYCRGNSNYFQRIFLPLSPLWRTVSAIGELQR